MAVYTFLFSDIQGSTALWEAFPSEMDSALARHDELLHRAVTDYAGEVFKHTGDGMAAAFHGPLPAFDAALKAQQGIVNEDWGVIGSLKVRMGMHTGEVFERDGDYFGASLNHVSRLMSAAHGGQILVSEATSSLTQDLPDGASLVDLGVHRLRDISRAYHVYHLQHPDLPTDFPPIKSEKSGNLPDSHNDLFGRETELKELTSKIQNTRLITLTGFGGTGKTRLATELGRISAGQFRDGVWIHELAATEDQNGLPREAAALFGVGEDGLDNYLAEKQLLFILDNCEHLLSGATALIRRLLASPGVTVVATSREALNIAGEQIYAVSPLLVPDETSDRLTLGEYPAIQMFQQRARAGNPTFTLTDENAAAVGQIVRRLDGIPLAIELAAARVKLLPPREIANRLDESFKLLRGGPVNAMPHHQTLELTIDWSYDALSQEQQTLFRQLSVFRGGIDLAALTSVTGTEDEYEILGLLGQLVDKSLVQTIHSTDGTRYRVLQPLIQYAEVHTDDPEARDLKSRHALYFRDLAEQAAPELRGPRQLDWLATLEMEHDNLRAALAWAIEIREADLAQRTVTALTWFWILHRYVAQSSEWFARALAIEGRPSTARAAALVHSGFIGSMLRQDDLDGCLAEIRQGSAIFTRMQDQQGIGTAQINEAVILWFKREFDQARQQFSELQISMRSAGVEWAEAFCGWFLGSIAWSQGEFVEARDHCTRGLESFRRLGDLALIAWSLVSLGNIARDTGDLDGSVALYNQCLPMMSDLGDRHGVGAVLMGLGVAKHFQGNVVESQRLIAEAQVQFREGTGGQGLSWALSHSPVDTRTFKLLREVTSRYEASLTSPTAEWTRMVIQAGMTWRENR